MVIFIVYQKLFENFYWNEKCYKIKEYVLYRCSAEVFFFSIELQKNVNNKDRNYSFRSFSFKFFTSFFNQQSPKNRSTLARTNALSYVHT